MRIFLLIAVLIMPLAVLAQTICIDPGHPSENGNGSRGKKLTEVQAAWSVAQRLKTLLETDGYRVVMTKSSENEVVTNRRRAEIANEAKADLMVRLHCDAASSSGISVYYPSRKGKVGDATGPDDDVLKNSRERAKKFYPALIEGLDGKHPGRGLMTDLQTAIGARQGALTGSIYSQVPVLLVEMAVLTNSKDEAFLTSKKGHELLCQALLKGVQAAVPKAKRS